MTEPSPSPQSDQRQLWYRIGIWFCLLAQFLLACDTGRQWTPTHDEYWHLPLGLLIWKTGRLDYDVINPPLLRLWAAWPLYLGGAQLDLDVPYEGPGITGDLFWTTNTEHRMLWYALGRAMVALINLATGWLLALWGRRWFGELAGFTAVLLWCCCPTVLANGCVVTHDAAAAFGFVSTLFAVVCWCEQPTARRAAVVGICLGLAQLLKVTCILLFPLTVITWLLIRPTVPGSSNSRDAMKRLAMDAALILGLAILVINIGYLGQQPFQTLASIPFGSKRFQSLQTTPLLQSLPIPLPRCYIQAFDRVAQDLQSAHPVYLDGNWRARGFPQYYIMAMLYKLPLGTLLLIAISLMIMAHQLWQRRANRRSGIPNPIAANQAAATDQPTSTTVTRTTATAAPNSDVWRRQLVLLIPVLLLIVPASFSSNQIGIRYIFPVLPLLYLFATQAIVLLQATPHHWQRWLVLLCLVSLPLSLRYHPHHLAYFNEYAGGPAAGRKLLVDSNLDWGQDLHGLAAFLQQTDIKKIRLAYFGTVHPHSLGIDFELPRPKQPEPGEFALSANFIAGRAFVIRTPTPDHQPPTPTKEQPIPTSEPYVAGTDDFGYFRFFQPYANIGHSIFLYRLTEEDVNRFHQTRRRLLGY